MNNRFKGKNLLFTVSSVLYVLASTVQVVYAILLGRFIDNAIEAHFQQMMKEGILLAAALVFYLVAAGTGYRVHAQFTKLGLVHMKRTLLQSFFHRQTKAFLQLDDSYYINLLNTDTEIMRTEVFGSVPFILACILQAGFAAIAIYRLNVLMFFASVSLAIVPILITNIFTKGLQRRRNDLSQGNEEYMNISKESVQGYETIKAVGKADIWQERVNQVAQRQQKAAASMFIFSNMSNQTIRSLTSIMQLLAIGFAGYLIATRDLTPGALFSIVLLISDISAGTNNMIELINSIHSAKGIQSKIRAESTIETVESTHETELPEIKNPEIRFEKIGFGFDGKQLFSNFTFCFEAGKCYVIIGESGCGKTTLMKLILKYFDGYEGSIKISDYNIENLSENTVCSWVGIVDQVPYLFNRSLFFNIMLTDEADPNTQEVYSELLEKFHLKELALRVGEKPLGDFGDNISGGERQRICIARVMANRPSILIFDEPTASLDPENKAQIMDLIFSLNNVTRIVISHDWAQESLMRFDGIVKI